MRKITEEEMLEEICSLIWYQCAIKDQDLWLRMMIDMDMWEPPEKEPVAEVPHAAWEVDVDRY